MAQLTSILLWTIGFLWEETVTTEVTDFSYIQNGSLIRVGDEGVSMLIGIEADYSAEGSTIKIIREKLANDM